MIEKHLCLTCFLPKDDDEWDDYRENKKDYTGLKIENLTQEQPKEEEEEETEVVKVAELYNSKSQQDSLLSQWNTTILK